MSEERSVSTVIELCGCFRNGCPICRPGTETDRPMRPERKQRMHPATWEWSLPNGALQLSIPLPITADDADDIEKLLALVMRGIRRDLIEEAAPQVKHAGDPQTATDGAIPLAGRNAAEPQVTEGGK